MDRKEYQKKIKQERKLTHPRVEIQLTASEYKRFEKIAKAENTTVNTVVKNMAIAYRDTKYLVPTQIQDSLNTLTRLVRNIAGNLNQLSHTSNIFRDIDQNLVFEHLAQLDKKIDDFVQGKLKQP
ncbi:hypothetical protein [Motiliproteus sp. MSK22-1]|uniref:hypothetical protein n=1 Tax=Motiliproteus sp. MSK22-1 TaxID=1897630 RepID=UPI000978213B|nr:hypothetical protein [Motiliproteus sp. MSK22-1]OMH28069.1 hypothetical protein BGP75_22135 [Motiliproteus sp. MSK22-1]